MGEQVTVGALTKDAIAAFEKKVWKQQVPLLAERLRRPTRRYRRTIGSETEVVAVAVDDRHRPVSLGPELFAEASRLGLPAVPELLDADVETNGSVHPDDAMAVDNYHEEERANLATLGKLIAAHGGELFLGGILPTMTLEHATPARFPEDCPRYPAMQQRYADVYGLGNLDLRGDRDSLYVPRVDFALAGIGHAFQGHISFDAQTVNNGDDKFNEFVLGYNTLQWVASLILAATAGSPLLLGRELWQETRVPLFDACLHGRSELGNGWIQNPVDAFTGCLKHAPMLPKVTGDPDELLTELKLWIGTVPQWIRPVLEPDGIVRAEVRMISAGPTADDQAANLALIKALCAIVMPEMGAWLRAGLPYAAATDNFHMTARHPLTRTHLSWPGYYNRTAQYILLDLLNRHADRVPAGTEKYLEVIDHRVSSGHTAAYWLGEAHRSAPRHLNVAGRAEWVTRRYMDNSQRGLGAPVHTWEL